VQAQTSQLQAAELQVGGGPLKSDCLALHVVTRFLQGDTVHVLAMLAQVQQHAIRLMLCAQGGVDAAQRCYSCLVQPAVGPGGNDQAAVVAAPLQHCQQAGVWQVQQSER
jgi:hypothetical protein